MIRNSLVLFFSVIFAFISPASFGYEKARAYLVDGNSGTRSGPLRNANDHRHLELDRLLLVKYALNPDRSSGIAKKGDNFWTNEETDWVIEQDKGYQQRQANITEKVAREEKAMIAKIARDKATRDKATRDQAARDKAARDKADRRRENREYHERNERNDREKERYKNEGGASRTPY